MRVRVIAGLIATAASLAFTAGASAATVLGSVDPNPTPSGCNVANADYVQKGSGALPPYTVPAGGGVITSWRTKFGPVGATVKLLVLKAGTGNNFKLVADSGFKVLTSALGESSFTAQIPVGGGEFLGRKNGPTAVDGGCFSAPGTLMGVGTTNPFAIGDEKPFADSLGSALNISATLEADADKDGFGDETQDICPTDGTKQGDCAAPSALIDKRPKKKTDSAKATFRFSSDDPNATFQCAIDKKPLKPCTSPKKFRKLKERKHRFRLVATDAAGNVSEETTARWRVVD